MPIEQRQPQGLVDILDKILDKGLVVAGDIKVSLANVELLTIQLRLVICSIDEAQLVGIDLITVEARVVIASIDTYLKYAEAVGAVPTVSRPALGAAEGGSSGIPSTTPASTVRR